MMPNLEYFLICESLSTDRETNRVSLFNVLEELQVLGKEETSAQPVPFPRQLVAVSCWNREPGDENQDYQATLKIHGLDQEHQGILGGLRHLHLHASQLHEHVREPTVRVDQHIEWGKCLRAFECYRPCDRPRPHGQLG